MSFVKGQAENCYKKNCKEKRLCKAVVFIDGFKLLKAQGGFPSVGGPGGSKKKTAGVRCFEKSSLVVRKELLAGEDDFFIGLYDVVFIYKILYFFSVVVIYKLESD